MLCGSETRSKRTACHSRDALAVLSVTISVTFGESLPLPGNALSLVNYLALKVHFQFYDPRYGGWVVFVEKLQNRRDLDKFYLIRNSPL